MRSINADVLTKLAAEEITPFILLYLDLDTDRYYTTCDVPLVYDGNKYLPRGFEPETISYGTNDIVDQVTLKIDNTIGDLTDDLIDGTVQGQTATLSLILLDADKVTIVGGTITQLFSGEIDSWSIETDNQVSLTITNQLAKWNRRTLSNHSSSCRWKQFKGAVCGYSGAETYCDRSYARCLELGNTANFGGFRWLPSIEGKEIWWGRVKG